MNPHPSSGKKIFIIGPAHPLRGGLASYNERLAREFMKEGADVSIYTFSLQYPGFLFPGTTQYSSEPTPADLSIRVCINSINPINWIKIGRQIKKQAPDVVVVRYWLPFMGPCLGTILRIVRKNKKTRVVCIADNVIPHEKRPGDKMFTGYFSKAVDAFITMSEKVLNDLQPFAKEKSARFVPHPLYDNFGDKMNKAEARKKLGLEVQQKIVLFFGFIRKYKGLDWLYEAIQILKEKYPQDNDIRFLVAGEFYEDRQPYDELITRLGIADRLILHTDFIPDSSVGYYLSASDLVIQPYKSATQSGVTPLAYHFEVPMVVTRVGGLPSLVPDGRVGLIAEPHPASIAEKIHAFFQEDSAAYIEHIKAEKQKYSWSNMVNAIMESAEKKG
jgi:glycosyltransferase involved in cell wall biosynthesis